MATVNLKFVFANRDGVTVELENVPTTQRVSELKQQLVQRWPEGA